MIVPDDDDGLFLLSFSFFGRERDVEREDVCDRLFCELEEQKE